MLSRRRFISLCLAPLLPRVGSGETLRAATAAGKPAYLVGFAQDTLQNDWRLAQVRALERAFAGFPEIRFLYTDAGGLTARQILHVEDLVYRGVDLLMTSPRDALALDPVISQIYKQGVPVVLLTRRIVSDNYTTLVHPDDFQVAQRAAEFLVERLNGRGRVLMLRGVPTTTTALQRGRGFEQVVTAYPEIKVVSRTANYLRHEALRVTAELLEQGERFDALYAQSDSLAGGARIAFRAFGIDPGKLISVGVDYIHEAREAIRRGEQSASLTYPTCGREGAETALKLLRGIPVERDILVQSVMVTPENVEHVEPIF